MRVDLGLQEQELLLPLPDSRIEEPVLEIDVVVDKVPELVSDAADFALVKLLLHMVLSLRHLTHGSLQGAQRPRDPAGNDAGEPDADQDDGNGKSHRHVSHIGTLP